MNHTSTQKFGNQDEISEKEKNDSYTSGSIPGVLYEFAKIQKALWYGTPLVVASGGNETVWA